jgi:hypothetical protein
VRKALGDLNQNSKFKSQKLFPVVLDFFFREYRKERKEGKGRKGDFFAFFAPFAFFAILPEKKYCVQMKHVIPEKRPT